VDGNPDARARYAEDLARRLRELAQADDDEPLPGSRPSTYGRSATRF
jgi:hypothetical protein